jgi:uncharacterized protein (UPF0332 family)
MGFDWAKYLTLAQEQVELSKKHTNKDALLRCAISRAYYSAFCNARNYLRDFEKAKGLGKSSKVHQLVIDQFEGSNNTTKKDIGAFLRRLREFRNNADYQDRFRNLETTVLLSLKFAEEVIENLEKLRL